MNIIQFMAGMINHIQEVMKLHYFCIVLIIKDSVTRSWSTFRVQRGGQWAESKEKRRGQTDRGDLCWGRSKEQNSAFIYICLRNNLSLTNIYPIIIGQT